MESETFRSRFLKLLQKSRKALTLYTSMGQASGGKNSELTELQIQEWKRVNADLLQHLTMAMEEAHSDQLVSDIYTLRNRFYSEWRKAESELHSQHKELIYGVENGDFIKAANLSRKLAVLKARVQAAQAAHHELQGVINQSSLSEPTDPPEYINTVEGVGGTVRQAKVIPLRKK